MPRIQLTGILICANDEQAAIVATQLPRHIELTRAEAGCIRFDVTPTDDPLVWDVAELFATEDAFRAHQERVAASEWGAATAGIERKYSIQQLAD
ncbi:quinol monooxygenase YgiN [Microbacterium sp. SORGH_AS428]|uniref:putative quinol monooxygenase n=1 Tax=Microbacterium sp. SORGH_AS_0428 TaxID=3041788 RepID=UPI00286730CA|nr:antibiotic biosynthesis monooxygenase [Microbacterium sp. SORGH_AS_0428]MDR6199844.1 quinol monooxygenase YgiN [Microbacterium sp. SORGH_AS_0428]